MFADYQSRAKLHIKLSLKSQAPVIQRWRAGPGGGCEFLMPAGEFRCLTPCSLCSAGAGRTGTFIALSNILERVKAEGLLDVFQAVKSLRLQRPHMVQTLVRNGFQRS